MIGFFKWFNSKVEISTLWFAGYCFVLRIFCDKFFHSISDQTFYTISIIGWTVLSFFAWSTILKRFKEKMYSYKFWRTLFLLVYILGTPVCFVYFMVFHPLLGTFVTFAVSMIPCYIIIFLDHFQKKQA